MPKNDIMKGIVAKMQEEVAHIQCEIERLEKRRERIYERRALTNIQRGENDNAINM